MSHVEQLLDDDVMIPPIPLANLTRFISWNLAAVCSFLGFLYYKREYIWHTPGVGIVKDKRNRTTRKNVLYVESELGKIEIPTFSLSNISEVDIYIFDHSVVLKTELLSKEAFKEKYSMFNMKPLQKHRRFFITPVINTSQCKDNTLSGVIMSLTEFHVLPFRVDNDFVNYGELYNHFLELLAEVDEADDVSPTENHEDPATPTDDA